MIIDPSSATVHVKAEPDDSKKAPEEKPLPRFERPEWVIVYITAIYVLIAWWTLRAIKRQADTMEMQANEARQSAATATTIAQKAADAALLNAQAIITSERPFIKVEVRSSDDGQHFQIMATNCGKTPAEILIDGSQWDFCDNQIGPPNPPSYHIDELISVYRRIVAPGDKPFPTGDPLMVSSMREGGPQLMQDVDRYRKFLFFWGKIAYIGALGKERKGIVPYETRWCFQYIPSAKPPYLKREGLMGYNEHT